MIDKNIEIFEGKTFSALAKDIYNNQQHKKTQIDILIDDLRVLIKSTADATMLAPMVRDYIESGIKNDELLVKLQAVLQRWICATTPAEENDAQPFGLSDADKEKLLAEVSSEIKEIKTTGDGIKPANPEVVKKEVAEQLKQA